ncbi:DUF6093 family protein [Streptomyces sp. PTM05]|uniref:DUF6093 family protein n=1 Tax=Streptantibioticus parmotrematis TaxID=2873249 RepID=A0ABS7R186_9ACTN|nr:DUF6093 family protein [Streptantibioticus parmotrematis]MBY8889221.1 DUF6093 family protein [Streptantibioticus parmotrematis]
MSASTEGLTLGAVSAIVEKKILTNKIRIYRPGEPVFNPDTGQYEPGPPITIYEGPGAIFPIGGPSVVLHLAGQAYAHDASSGTDCLSAPVASREDTVTVVQADDESAVGRTWRVIDIGETSTLSIVRTTWVDQNTQTTGAGV